MRQQNILVVAILLFCLLSNIFLITYNYQHDCSHTDTCPICILMNGNEQCLRLIGLAFLLTPFLYTFLYNNQEIGFIKHVNDKKSTLISQKVRLNN